MTKRFILFEDLDIKDTVTGRIIPPCLDKGLSELVNLLNTLNEENEQLEEARAYYQKNFLTMKTERHQFKRENEQLQQELFESEKECIMIDYRDNPIRRNDKIIDLKEEYKERFGRDFE